MAAVLWVDTMQCFVMLSGLFAVLIIGIMRVGGINEVINLARENGRFTANKYRVHEKLFSMYFCC